MEGFRNEENRPDITDLLLALREKTDEDMETRRNLEIWMNEQKQRIDSIQDPQKRAIAFINFDRQMARLHYAAGYPDAAWQELQDARDHAVRENLDNLVAEIKQEMEEFDRH